MVFWNMSHQNGLQLEKPLIILSLKNQFEEWKFRRIRDAISFDLDKKKNETKVGARVRSCIIMPGSRNPCLCIMFMNFHLTFAVVMAALWRKTSWWFHPKEKVLVLADFCLFVGLFYQWRWLNLPFALSIVIYDFHYRLYYCSFYWGIIIWKTIILVFEVCRFFKSLTSLLFVVLWLFLVVKQ